MPINSRRQTLGAVSAKPPMPSSMSRPTTTASTTTTPSTSSLASDASRKKIPRSRKSMIPRMAGSENAVNQQQQQQHVMSAASPLAKSKGSRIAAPSPSRVPKSSSRPPAAAAAAAASSRKSLGGPIILSSATPSKNRRVSLAPSSSATHSSSQYTTTDPRDIKDKSYLNNSIRKMVSYLKSHGYDSSPLNVKQLVNGPSGRDFNHFMTFLLRRVDPTFNSTYGGSIATTSTTGAAKRSDDPPIKFEDEVSMAFRTLGYPFPISKTGIVAVGAPHTWPALIAAIDWLIDVLVLVEGEERMEWEVEMSVVNGEGGGGGEEVVEEEQLYSLESNALRAQHQFDAFLRKSMVAFMNDDNEECDELEGELLEVWNGDNEKVDGYLAGLDEECGRMREEMKRLEREGQG
eukprot:scaffold13330_cov205-Alexandrium_tamarense.AAC.20